MSAEEKNNHEEYEEESLMDDEGGIVHEDTEGVWLISYADMMTLLMGFFALMLSMSTFDENQFTAIGEGTAEFFGGEIERPYDDLGEAVEAVIKKKNLGEKVKVEIQKTQLVITFEGTLLFKSGAFNLKSEAHALMKELIQILDDKAGNKKVLIEGHTDNTPINRGIIASNWELSSLRANSVARLFESYKFKRNQILTIGLGETRPVSSNINEDGTPSLENQAQNRRVVIKVMNKHPL